MRGFQHESQINESIEWYTPPEIFTTLNTTFDLDPCSPGEGKDFVPARKRYTIHDDGLVQPWDGFVWLNPPYGRETGKWLKKLAHHGDGIALVFARTDVNWFHETARSASSLCFIARRVRFYKGGNECRGGSPGAGSMLIGFGNTAKSVLMSCGLGFSIDLDEQPHIIESWPSRS